MQSLSVLGTLKTTFGQNLVRLLPQAVGKGEGKWLEMPAAFSQIFLKPKPLSCHLCFRKSDSLAFSITLGRKLR